MNNVTTNKPLRLGKGYCYEGGHREPMIVCYPPLVPAGAVCRTAVISTDFYPTILDLVGGMPLGILLAASWVDTLPVDEIAVEITRSMDFLETETTDMPDRHRSMRAVFDYSWSMLGEDEQRMFAALSAFRGGFTREAADGVAGASLRGLSNLVGKSLVVADRHGMHPVDEDVGRL